MLRIHRAPRADLLVEVLAHILSVPLDDPFAGEVVAVPTRGVERWLSQTLALHLGAAGLADGVCANVAFPSPGRLVVDVLAQVAEPAWPAPPASADGGPPDPWDPECLVWPLLDVIDAELGAAWLAPLASYLHRGGLVAEAGGSGDARNAADDGGGPGPGGAARRVAPSSATPVETATGFGRRYAVAARLARVFHRYGLDRPSMLRAWARREGPGPDPGPDGRPLPPDTAWQPELWRRVRTEVGVPSPAERLPGACERIRSDPGCLDLPPRLAVCNLTRLPEAHAAVLGALAHHRDVHLLVLHPSDVLWQEVDGALARPTAGTSRRARRADDETAERARNPLLANWGRDARELQLVLRSGLADPAPPIEDRWYGGAPPDPDVPGSPPTLLARLQQAVRANSPAPLGAAAAERPVLDRADRSVQVHACHGRVRQVEVLRDAICHALAEDPSLEPRDVIVLCPDVERFAPLVRAAFGADDLFDAPGAAEGSSGGGTERLVAATDRPPELRVRIADRNLVQLNGLLAALVALVEVVGGRFGAGEVVDFLAREPVRRRLGLDDDDVTRLADFVSAAHVRWGLDPEHRARQYGPKQPRNTWAEGLDRLALGVALGGDPPVVVDGVLPLDGVASSAIGPVGALLELLERLAGFARFAAGRHPVAEWVAELLAVSDALFAADDDAWQRLQLGRILRDVADGADGAQGLLTRSELSTLLAERVQGRPTRANFRTGHLTVCSLEPMRAVPHRVVCLLGLDDEAFPRRRHPDGDDLVERVPLVGDHDARSEDRQILLDALLSAGSHLVVVFNGIDERTNAPLPPAVPIGELLDLVDATVQLPSGAPARTQVAVRHPLHGFDAQVFRPGALGLDGPWGYDPAALGAARAAAGSRSARTGFAEGLVLDDWPGDVLELDLLQWFLGAPVRTFLRERLGLRTERPDELDDGLPTDLDGLGRWHIGQRLVEAGLAGIAIPDAAVAERARSELPALALGDGVVGSVARQAAAVVKTACELGWVPGSAPAPVPVDLDGPWPGNAVRRVRGVVTGVRGTDCLLVGYRKLGPKPLLEAWVRLLALSLHDPSVAWTVTVVGSGGSCRFEALGRDRHERARRAREHLAALVDLFERGMRQPLPLFVRTSHAHADARSGDRERAARKVWEGEFERKRGSGKASRGVGRAERDEPEHVLVWGPARPFDDLLREPPAADEAGWFATPGPSRFACLAERLWDPPLDHLSRSQRTPRSRKP